MEIAIRDIITIITILGAIITFHIKAFHNFFMSIVKMKYKEAPGNQPIFDVIIKWIGYIGFFVYLIVTFSLFVQNLKTNKPTKYIDLVGFIGIIIFIIFIMISAYVVWKMAQRFLYLKDIFYKKLEGKSIDLANKTEKANIKSIWLFSCSTVVFSVAALGGISQNIAAENGNFMLFKDYTSIKPFLICIIMVIIFSTLLLISINLQEIIKSLKSGDLYLILVDDEKIYCSCYLQYKDYYLVIKSSNERYINKSKVKEIRKIKVK